MNAMQLFAEVEWTKNWMGVGDCVFSERVYDVVICVR